MCLIGTRGGHGDTAQISLNRRCWPQLYLCDLLTDYLALPSESALVTESFLPKAIPFGAAHIQ